MKNRRALQGHHRVLVMVGTRAGTRQPSTGGWDVSCACGWSGGNERTATLATAMTHPRRGRRIRPMWGTDLVLGAVMASAVPEGAS